MVIKIFNTYDGHTQIFPQTSKTDKGLHGGVKKKKRQAQRKVSTKHKIGHSTPPQAITKKTSDRIKSIMQKEIKRNKKGRKARKDKYRGKQTPKQHIRRTLNPSLRNKRKKLLEAISRLRSSSQKGMVLRKGVPTKRLLADDKILSELPYGNRKRRTVNGTSIPKIKRA